MFQRRPGGLIMDENRVEGSLRNIGGKVQEGVGRTTGDTKSTVEGVMNQAAGTAQNLYGQSADVARETASNLDTWLRNTIENQPYTSAIVALGIGWLLGRMHRPLWLLTSLETAPRPNSHPAGFFFFDRPLFDRHHIRTPLGTGRRNEAR